MYAVVARRASAVRYTARVRSHRAVYWSYSVPEEDRVRATTTRLQSKIGPRSALRDTPQSSLLPTMYAVVARRASAVRYTTRVSSHRAVCRPTAKVSAPVPHEIALPYHYGYEDPQILNV